MRSILFVPGDSDRKLAKAPSSGADILVLDLEDAVALDAKQAAREMTAAYLAEHTDREKLPPLYVRINDLQTGLAEDDLDAVLPARPAGIMLPKPRCGSDVTKLGGLLDARESAAGLEPGSLPILTIANEVASAVVNMASFIDATPRLEGLCWGSEDLATAIGAKANRDHTGAYIPPLLFSRNLCLLTATAANVFAIDTVFTNFRDLAGLEAEARDAARDGFTGKMAIHPDQIPIINEAFTPNGDEIADAKMIIEAFEADPGAGVINLEGRMIDRPHLEAAKRTLRQARLAGL